MAVKTSNFYGKITISDNALAMMAHCAANDCYGIVELVSRRFSDSIMELFHREPIGKGVKVETVKNKINLQLYVVLKDGVNVEALVESIQSTVKYNVETYTGMRVNSVEVNVVGVKL